MEVLKTFLNKNKMRLFILVLVILSLLLTGCSLREDVEGSAALIKSELGNAKESINNEVNSAKDLYNDVKTAVDEVNEAADALEAIGN